MISIKGIAGAAAILIGLSAPSAQAGYVVDLTQQGSNVVATGSGTIDLTDLSIPMFGSPAFTLPFIQPQNDSLITGPASGGEVDFYGKITGPASFGMHAFAIPSSGSGDIVGIDSPAYLAVPHGYISGSALSSTSTWDDTTLASLGVMPGTHEWTWGSGADADSFTLVIGSGSAVPEPSTWAMLLLGFTGLGCMGYRSAGRRTASHT